MDSNTYRTHPEPEHNKNKPFNSSAPIILALTVASSLFLATLIFNPSSNLLRWIISIASLGLIIFSYNRILWLVKIARQLQEEESDRVNNLKKLKQISTANDNYQQLLKKLLPLWQRQTELAKNQIEENVNELSQRFSDIHNRLQSAVDASRQTVGEMEGNSGLSSVIAFANTHWDK